MTAALSPPSCSTLGTYLLGMKRRLRERWVRDEMVLHVAAGWRTEVWIDAINDSQDGSRFDLESANVRVAPRDSADALDEEAAANRIAARGLGR